MSDELFELSEEDFGLMLEVPVCGCGEPTSAWEAYRTVLRGAADRDVRVGDDPVERTLFYVIAGVLSQIEATEHGTTIDYAWLTEKGRRLLALIDRYAATGYEATPVTQVRQAPQ